MQLIRYRHSDAIFIIADFERFKAICVKMEQLSCPVFLTISLASKLTEAGQLQHDLACPLRCVCDFVFVG